MAGGGKGDKQSSQIKLPPEIEALAKRNLAGAERAGQIGYVPYEGPTVAALNPMQTGAMQGNYAAMNAFGVPGAVNPAAAIPKPTTYAGGVQGYDPLALYAQAISKINPAQKAAITSFVKPTGAAVKTDRLGVPTPTPAQAARRKATAAAAAAAKPAARDLTSQYWDWGLNGGAGGFRTWGR